MTKILGIRMWLTCSERMNVVHLWFILGGNERGPAGRGIFLAPLGLYSRQRASSSAGQTALSLQSPYRNIIWLLPDPQHRYNGSSDWMSTMKTSLQKGPYCSCQSHKVGTAQKRPCQAIPKSGQKILVCSTSSSTNSLSTQTGLIWG